MNIHGIFIDLPGMDGSHWGVSDLYDDRRAALEEALASSKDFSTGWWGSKKEIQSGRVSRSGRTVIVEASVSDDFDTEGYGRIFLEDPGDIDAVLKELDSALEMAEKDRKDNAVYRGYSVGHHEGGGRTDWIWSYIQPVGWGCEMSEPPGDCYYEWGWDYGGISEEEDKLTQEEREAMENWIEEGGDGSLIVGRWMIEPWEKEEEES